MTQRQSTMKLKAQELFSIKVKLRKNVFLINIALNNSSQMNVSTKLNQMLLTKLLKEYKLSRIKRRLQKNIPLSKLVLLRYYSIKIKSVILTEMKKVQSYAKKQLIKILKSLLIKPQSWLVCFGNLQISKLFRITFQKKLIQRTNIGLFKCQEALTH